MAISRKSPMIRTFLFEGIAMMHNMWKKTPEERKAIAAKGHATKRANKERLEAARFNALVFADGLKEQIEIKKAQLADLERMELFNCVSAKLTNKCLLTEDEIVAQALPWEQASGVYFLIHQGRVVYVGQAVNVYVRISQHTEKKFDRYAYLPCPAHMMDKIESLYIHLLRPELNGNQVDGAKFAPIQLKNLFAIGEYAKT